MLLGRMNSVFTSCPFAFITANHLTKVGKDVDRNPEPRSLLSINKLRRSQSHVLASFTIDWRQRATCLPEYHLGSLTT